MNSKKASGLFLTQIIISIGVTLLLSLGNIPIELGIITNLLLSESMLIIPAIIFMMVTKEKTKNLISFRKVKISTFFLTLLFTFLLSPLIMAVNAFSMIFTDNAVMEISSEVLNQPYIVMVLIIGFLGPFCEEYVFRGVIYGAFRKTGKIVTSIVLQALLFGLMHLNFNQFCYAFVIGVFLALLVEITDSIWCSFAMHAAINSSNVTLMYLTNPYLQENDRMLEMAGMSYTDTMILVACIYLVIAVFTTTIALCVLYKMAKLENGIQRVASIMSKNKEINNQKLISPITIMGIAISFLFIIIVEILKRCIFV
ncbi:MAG: type II CAAX endopeptidase family protein [Lachnospiraceae bacterium]|nr:type II CAAX endopeptidase family protein [Lachnospiraceae bacterium]